MSWRPEGWENIYKDTFVTTGEASVREGDRARELPQPLVGCEAVFEAGADILLEAQWELGIPWPPPDSLEGYILWVLGAIVDTGILYGDVKGKMVFI